MIIDDATYWPDPAMTGSFEFMVCRAHPSTGNKNGFTCTARSGTTLTVAYLDRSSNSAYAATAQSYAVGDYAGAEASDWRRTMAALPAGENGKPTNDAGASGAVPLRSKLAGNAYSVPRDVSLWQYGWYGHASNQTTWADWTGWQGASPLTPRGVSQGAAAKFRLWDGDEFYIQWRQKLDPRFYANHAQPDPTGTYSYWGRKAVAIQSEMSSLNQLLMSVSTSNRFSIPDTTKAPVSLATYKASRTIGVSDYAGRVNPSYQKNSAWDIAPHYANLSSSFKPSTGLSTPDGSTAWELPDGEWVTFLLRVKPGRSNVPETEIDLSFARTEDPAYTGAYTTLVSVTDANIVYSGQGDYDYPDGAFSYPTVAIMNALPGFQSFGIMGYFNITQNAEIPPPKASYYIRMAQVIFSKAMIPAPVSDLPTWAPDRGHATTFIAGGGVLTNNYRDTLAPYYADFWGVKSINDFSGMVFNPDLGTYGAMVCYADGGHAGTNHNGAAAPIRTKTAITWTNLLDGTPWFGTGTDLTTTQNNNIANVNSLTNATFDGGGSPQAGSWGDPITGVDTRRLAPSSHSYGMNTIRRAADGGAPYGTWMRVGHKYFHAANSSSIGGVHKLDFNSLTNKTLNIPARAAAAPVALGASGGSSGSWHAFVPSQNRTYICTTGVGQLVRYFDWATELIVDLTGTTSFTFSDTSDQGYSGWILHIPERQLLVAGFRVNVAGVWKARIQWMDVSTSTPTLGGTANLSSDLLLQPFTGAGEHWVHATWCSHAQRLIIGAVLNGASIDTAAYHEVAIPSTLSNSWTVTRRPFTTGSIPWSSGTDQRPHYSEATRTVDYFPVARRSDQGADQYHVFTPFGV
jgi:hypothetical protein